MHDLGDKVPADQKAVYYKAMATLNHAKVPYLVAGAMAIYYYTGSWRNTKDLDLFVTPQDRDAALGALCNAGYRTEVVVDSWLSKAFVGDIMVDIISGSGNYLAPVTHKWLERGEPVTILDLPTRIIAATDMIWSKSYIAGHERFDGADICHLIYRAPQKIDWQLLLREFGTYEWELLAVYVHLYRYVYPEARDHIPGWVVEELASRSQQDVKLPQRADLPFRGPLLDRYSYLVDVNEWGLPDPRLTVADARNIPDSEVLRERHADQATFDAMHPPTG